MSKARSCQTAVIQIQDSHRRSWRRSLDPRWWLWWLHLDENVELDKMIVLWVSPMTCSLIISHRLHAQINHYKSNPQKFKFLCSSVNFWHVLLILVGWTCLRQHPLQWFSRSYWASSTRSPLCSSPRGWAIITILQESLDGVLSPFIFWIKILWFWFFSNFWWNCKLQSLTRNSYMILFFKNEIIYDFLVKY